MYTLAGSSATVWDQGLTLVTAPVEEPVTVAEAQAYSFQTVGVDDALFTTLLTAARQEAERWTGRKFVTQTWRLTLDDFPGGIGSITLPFPPLRAVNPITYYDADNVLTTLDAAEYVADTTREPGWVVPAEEADWPTTYERINAVTITFEVGYGGEEDVPAGIKLAILHGVKFAYDNRDVSEGYPESFYNLLSLYKVWI